MDTASFFQPGTPMSDEASLRTAAVTYNIPEDSTSGINDVYASMVRNAKAALAGAFLQTDVGKTLAAEAEKQKIQERVSQIVPAAIVGVIAFIVILLLVRR